MNPLHKNMARTARISLGVFSVVLLMMTLPASSRVRASYVGSKACAECHESEYQSFQTQAKKARSYESILKMRSRLTDAEFRECFECHTTGHNQPGGFRSEQETPDLKNAGCEVCHGPGSVHVATGSSADIRVQLSAADCEKCHNTERIEAFNFKPLIFGGAH